MEWSAAVAALYRRVHRIAANIDGQIELVCGAFSSNPRKSKASGKDFFLPAKRCYGTFQEMIEKESNCLKASAWILCQS